MLLLSLWPLLLLPLKYLQRQPVLCSCLYYSKPPPQSPPHKKACWITTNAEMNRHPAKKRTNPTNWMWLCMSVFGFVGFKLHLYLVFVSVFVLLLSLLSGQVLSCHCDGSGRRCIEVPTVGRSFGCLLCFCHRLDSIRFTFSYMCVSMCMYAPLPEHVNTNMNTTVNSLGHDCKNRTDF